MSSYSAGLAGAFIAIGSGLFGAFLSGTSVVWADELTVAQIGEVETLPCSIFHGSGSGWVSLKDGATLTIPLSATNNKELFGRLGEHMNRCRAGIAPAAVAEADQ